MKTFTLLLMLGLSGLTVLAQNPPAKFGKPVQEDFVLTVCPIDSGANAYYIFDYAVVSFVYDDNKGWKWQMERHSKIRIVNDNGKDYANIIIPYHEVRTNKEYIMGLKGYTYNMEKGKIVKTKLEKSQIFDENVSEHLFRTKVTMPDIRAGSVIEVTYTLSSDFWAYLRDWEFQQDIPVLYSELNIGFPEYFNYTVNMKGYEPLLVNENSSKMGAAIITVNNGSSSYSGRQSYQSQTVNYTIRTKRLVAVNLPALKEEPYVSTMENYRTQIEFELASIRFPGSVPKEYSSSWDSVVDYLLKHDFFGMKLRNPLFARSDVKEIMEKNLAPYERMLAVYDKVKSTIKWDESYGMYSREPLRNVYSDGAGSAMDINFILINLLQAAGIQVYPVALSTRKNGIIMPTFPTVDKFNYVVAMAVIDGKRVFLDATDPYRPAGVLPPRCLNGKGRIIDDNMNDWVDLESPMAATEIKFYNLKLNEDGSFSGVVSTSLQGYSAMDFREKKDKSQSIEKLKEDIQAENPGMVIDSVNIEGLDEVDGEILVKYYVTISEQAERIGEMVMFSPLFYEKINASPFKLEERKFPVDFNYTRTDKMIYRIELPEGYGVEAIPESMNLQSPDKSLRFLYSATMIGNILNLNVVLQIKKPLFLPAEYQIIREFFAAMVSKEAEMVTVTKSGPQAVTTTY